MTRARETLRVLRHAAVCGWNDYTVTFTWKTWLAGWFVRVVAQVSFFALIGRLLGSDERTQYLLVGNAILLMTVVSMFAIPSTAWERWAGTMPLLVASPTSAVLVFAGRSVWVLADGLASAVGAFFVAAAIFGIELPWPRVLLVVPLALLVGLSSYALALFLGGWVVRAPSMRNVASNVTHTTIMAIGGVNVPLAFYPGAVRGFAHVLPLTHGLEAIRDLLHGTGAAAILANAGLEAAVGAGWLALAFVTFDRWAEHGRRDGSIEFG
jgi:ABC-2 type transport system permease protein